MINIQNLYIKTNDMCVGDRYHNDYMDILVQNIEVNECNSIILEAFNRNWKTGNWVYDSYTKEELRRLNVIMRTKSKQTLLTRIKGFIEYISKGCPYTLLLNQRKIEFWLENMEKFSKKWVEVHNG